VNLGDQLVRIRRDDREGAHLFDRFPLEEAVNRQEAPPLTISLPERGKCADGLAFRVDWFSATLRVLAPIRDEAPAQRTSDTSPVLWLRRITKRSWLGAAFHRGG
jgi:hypothetical protein